jgi:hypothetical protein
MKVEAIFFPLLLFPLTQLFSQSLSADREKDTAIEKYFECIDTNSIRKHLYALAHDSMMGRRPGTAGEALTINYLANAFRNSGLTPAKNNSYLQPVHLLRASSIGRLSMNSNSPTLFADSSLIIRGNTSGAIRLSNATLVFVGYGITAPEYKWDDYKGIAVKGKIVVVLDGEPEQLTKRNLADTGARTYHSNYWVKVELAKQHGARGVVLLSERKQFSPIMRRWLQEDFTLLSNDNEQVVTDIFTWLTLKASEKFTSACKTSFKDLQEKAKDEKFLPVGLPVTINLSIDTKTIRFTSYNVAGYIKGSDPKASKECIIYSTHWDAFGINLAQKGDSIYNGAKDNAGGIAEMITIASAMRSMKDGPKRSVVFLASTAEESGMLGAEAYVRSPLFPLSSTVLAIGMDIFAPWGHITEFDNIGYGYTSLDTLISALAAKREILCPRPKISFLFSASDHYRFACRGVPAVFAGAESGSLSLSKATMDSIDALTPAHSPFDQIYSGWNLQSAAEEARILFELGVMVANSNTSPQWTVNSRFGQARKKKKM